MALRSEPPPFGPERSHHQAILKWGQDAIQEGESFLRSQPGYQSFDDTLNAIMGEFSGSDMRPSSLSQVSLNMFGKVALDLVSAETDIKPFWDYRTKNSKFQPQAALANKYAEAWWIRRHISLRFADVIKYANAMGSGIAHHVYSPDLGDQDILPEDARDVLPIRPSTMYSIQDCYGVCVRRSRSMNWVKANYPEAAPYVRPDRDGSYFANRSTRVQKMLSAMGYSSGFMQNLWASLGTKPQTDIPSIPMCDVYTMYIKDDSKNTTGASKWMGLSDGQRTNWSYEVHPGQLWYPRKRCIIFTRTALLYDDTSIYWHGLFPLTKLTLDPWPWMWLGKAPLKDLLPLHAEVNRLTRIISQHHQRIERPGLAADKNSISQKAMERLDTARAGLKIRHNPMAGKGVELLHEPALDASVALERQTLIDAMKELSGARDISQLMNLGQIPTTETVEKILETMSPSVRLRSQVIEAFMGEFATIVLSNIFQFATLPERVAVLGPAGMTMEDFDYDPGSLIPDMIDEMGTTEKGDPRPRDERARTFLRNFTYEVAPGSLLASAGVTEKLLYIQLFRMGVMDIWTLGDKLSIPMIGEPPEGADTIPKRLQAMQAMGIGQTVSAAGRKSTGQQQPRMKISESG